MKKILVVALFSVLSVLAQSHYNGGRVVPVHRLAPLDADGEKVNVRLPYAKPFSLKATCSQCHDVAAMHGHSHFRTNSVPHSKDHEPFFLVASNRVVSFTLDTFAQTGLSYFEFVKEFGRAFPGGGIADDERAKSEVAGERSRWFVTGGLEPNCLACHQQTCDYDHSEWAKQIPRENFRGAAVAAAGFAQVGGMNSRMDSTWDSERLENMDDHLFRQPEHAKYDLAKFDDKGRCVFAVGKPQNARCLACHAATQAGMASHEIAGDVHLQRGMSCTDCHTCGIDHQIQTKKCTACHINARGAGPTPTHKGIPLVHFQRLSCTVCHSGVTRAGALAQVRTARANRIGIYGKAQWATDVPYIYEPVFKRNAEGIVKICRATWLSPDSEPVIWSFTHDVRPARQARGAAPNKCADCHTPDSPFFFGEITPIFPDGSKGKAVKQSDLLKVCAGFHKAFGTSFACRPLMKVTMWTIFALMIFFVVAALARAVNNLLERVELSTRAFLWGIVKWLFDIGYFVCAVYLALSGVIGWYFGGMTGWWLVAHTVLGAVFAACVLGMMLWRGNCHLSKPCACRPMVWSIWCFLAAAVVFTAVMPMMTVFGEAGQLLLLWAHRCCALTFVLVSCALGHCTYSGKCKLK